MQVGELIKGAKSLVTKLGTPSAYIRIVDYNQECGNI